ncbi:hypothetical protein KSP40_PGU000089 [Platanthera guangdongensis]|uniref:Secreted protein n=1 Tax=Platanthera guangdongensis TaxID=2320717 RepID=A0ABR2M032_9ASPA
MCCAWPHVWRRASWVRRSGMRWQCAAVWVAVCGVRAAGVACDVGGGVLSGWRGAGCRLEQLQFGQGSCVVAGAPPRRLLVSGNAVHGSPPESVAGAPPENTGAPPLHLLPPDLSRAPLVTLALERSSEQLPESSVGKESGAGAR